MEFINRWIQIYIKNRILALIGEEGTDKISNESDLKKIKRQFSRNSFKEW